MRYLPLAILLIASPALADPRIECPPPLTACKVLVLSPDEEKALMDQNGVLNTAAAARALDLGSVISYFRTKIATAPAGDVRQPEAKPADSGVAK